MVGSEHIQKLNEEHFLQIPKRDEYRNGSEEDLSGELNDIVIKPLF